MVSRKRGIFKQTKITEIEKMRNSKPREFWKLFRKKQQNGSDIESQQFHEYFRELAEIKWTSSNELVNKLSNEHDFDTNAIIVKELNENISIQEIIDIVK